jgi:hypothetical protein
LTGVIRAIPTIGDVEVRRIFYILPYLTRSNQHTRRSYSIFSAQLDSFAPLERTVSTGVVWQVKTSMICVAHRYSNNGGTLLQKVEKPKMLASRKPATSSGAEPTTGSEKRANNFVIVRTG